MPQITIRRFVVASKRPAKRRRKEERGDTLVSAAWLGNATDVMRLLREGVDMEATGSEALTEYLQGETALVAALKGTSETHSRSVV